MGLMYHTRKFILNAIIIRKIQFFLQNPKKNLHKIQLLDIFRGNTDINTE
jgi:hypothetical protein